MHSEQLCASAASQTQGILTLILLPRPSATPSETEGEFPAPAAPCRRLKRNAAESLGLEDVVMRVQPITAVAKLGAAASLPQEKGVAKRVEKRKM